jgi:hypothetical protein
MTRRRLVIGSILLCAVILGALREFLFLNLNYQIDFVAHDRAFSYAHSAFQEVVGGWSLRALVLLKWIAAMVCIASLLALSVGLSRQLFGDHRYRAILVVGFVAIASLALVLHLLGNTLPAAEAVSVKLLHLLQYPVVLFFLWAAAALRHRNA